MRSELMPRFHVRRQDRELTDPSDLASVLKRGRFATISMCHDGEPYLVTLSYGYDEAQRAMFFHVAPEGRKLDALKADSRVCATVIVDGGYDQGRCKHRYESVVLTGTMAPVADLDAARAGMRILLEHLEDDPAAVWGKNRLDADATYDRMRVLRLDIDEMTGKAGS
jgi:nitroimidazol reductase NimA-like FMN-containing flavoprotein (pyridoxamine 5'-phosphate oxidase superfamily)